MHDNTGKFSVSAQCGAFGMSRSGYYAWLHRRQNPGRRQMERERLDSLVAQAFEARKGRWVAAGQDQDLFITRTMAANMPAATISGR